MKYHINLGVLALALCLVTACKIGQGGWKTSPTTLQYRTIAKGVGTAAKSGDQVMIEETTSYPSGKVIFSTDQLGHPIRITLGAKQAISGVDEGVTGMKAGEVRELIVPPALSERSEYPDILHPDSVLHYRIRLVEIL